MRAITTAALLLAFTATAQPTVDEATAARFAKLALACVHKEYPNKLAHVLNGPADAKTPAKLTPAFYGCYDWHSAVHGQWLLARLARTFPEAAFTADARKALERSLTAKNVAGELAYFEAPGRVSFERPYGLAWLLQLSAELREWKDPDAQRWAKNLEPLELAAAKRLKSWLPKLSRPIRGGEHDQTAFAFGLMWDWAKLTHDTELTTLLEARINVFYGVDRDCPIAYEPGGQDFLSPCLAEADLMRRVDPKGFPEWFEKFIPPSARRKDGTFFSPEIVTDRSDPKLAHLDGLNLSRAWMLEGIVSALPPKTPVRAALETMAAEHRAKGLEAVTGEHYEGGHWLGSFATYLVTRRGIPAAP